MQISVSDALLIIDVQNDFCADGALAVSDGDAVVAPINQLAKKFPLVVLTQDWHPAGHSSFATQHPDVEAFSSIQMPYGEQTLWPDHCIQGESGAEFHRHLETRSAAMVIRKGHRPAIDSYSAFFENDHRTSTGLSGYLKELNIQRVFCTGLALDFCVRYSAQDARSCGFDTVVIRDACRAIDMNGSLEEALGAMRNEGVQIIDSAQIA